MIYLFLLMLSSTVLVNKNILQLSHWYKPEWNLESGGRELVEFFKSVNFTEADFRGPKTNRLPKLKQYFTEAKQ